MNLRTYMMPIALGALALASCSESGAQQANGAAQANDAAAAGEPASPTPLARTADDPQLQWGPCPELFPQGCEIAVLQGDPAQPNADVLLRIPGGSAIPAHRHTSAERMVLVDGTLLVRYQGTPPTLLREGSYAYGPPAMPHSAECRSSEPCVLFVAFEEPVDIEPFEGELD